MRQPRPDSAFDFHRTLNEWAAERDVPAAVLGEMHARLDARPFPKEWGLLEDFQRLHDEVTADAG